MTGICSFGLSYSQIFRNSLLFSKVSSPYTVRLTVSFLLPVKASFFASTTASSTTSGYGTFTWDDVLRISPTGTAKNDPSDLRGYFEKVHFCNRGSEKQSLFIPFVTEDQIVGYIHKSFAEILRRFKDVFTFLEDSSYGGHGHVALHPMLKTPHDRTEAVGNVIQCLGEEWIPGIRNELYPVTPSFGAPVLFSLERAAAPYFGIKAYGVHMNGYIEKDGQKYLWIGKRSQKKPTYPGMLDHLVAGGLPHGISCADNLIKECKEEAGIPISISIKAVPVGAVSYMDIDDYRYKRDVLFCYDLKLPESFVPRNEDGEVESFKLVSLIQVADVIRNTQCFKPNCSLIIIDFLIRHGYITPDCIGYLDLLRSLKSGDCS